MIQPPDIRRKAENLYEAFLHAWVAGEDGFFPKIVPSRKDLPADMAAAVRAVQQLRDGSKEAQGYGYSICWREVNLRKYGRNQIPEQISFETREDLLRFVGKEKEFAALATAVAQIRTAFPQLGPWVAGNLKLLVGLIPDIDGLLDVVRCLQEHPRPGCFVRELPLQADTKIVERHVAVLRQWLDRVLPAQAIRADEEHFERRYGLRYAEPHLLVRFLTPELQQELGFPCDELSLPLHAFSSWAITQAHVIVVENRVNLLTLPRVSRTIGIGGLGRAVALLRYLACLKDLPIIYWGDMDAEGYEILSHLRSIYPQTQSILMDKATLDRWRHLSVEGSGRQPAAPAHLTIAERAAYAACIEYNLRVEQERLPQAAAVQALSATTPSQKGPAQ